MNLVLAAAGHHVTGGAPPESFLQGLVSGFAHPLIGPDHLAFLLIAGLLIHRLAPRFRRAITALVVAGAAAGAGLHLSGVAVPAFEAMVLASVVAAGGWALLRRAAGPTVLGGLFAVAGIFHGYAYAESIIGGAAAPVLGYLIGLALIQSAVLLGVSAALDRVNRKVASDRDARI